MKLSLACISCLILAVVAAAAVGYAPTQSRWGDAGIRSMMAIAAICLCTSIVATLPMFIVAPRWPEQIGNAALAGTVIRLLATGGAIIIYQSVAQPHGASFLLWATIFYLLLLAVDVTFGVIAIQRHYRVTPSNRQGAAS